MRIKVKRVRAKGAEVKRRQRRDNTCRAGVRGGGKQNTGTELIRKAAIKGKFPRK